MNPGDHMIIGLAVRRRTRLGHPDMLKNSIISYLLKLIYKLNYYYKWRVQKWTNLKNISDLKKPTPPRDSTSIEC